MQAAQEIDVMKGIDPTTIPDQFNPLRQHLDERGNNYAGDEKLFVQFRTEAVLNPSKSTAAGHAVFDDVDMVIIHIPGSQLTSVVAPVKGEYLLRFGAKYRAWKAGQEEAVSGMPLAAFPFLINKPSLVAQLAALNIRTVEQLAGLADGSKLKIMGGLELSRRAQEFLDASKENAQATKLASELEKRDAEIAALKTQMQSLMTARPEPARK